MKILHDTGDPNPVGGVLLGELGQLVLHGHSALATWLCGQEKAAMAIGYWWIGIDRKGKVLRVEKDTTCRHFWVPPTARRLCSLPGLLETSVKWPVVFNTNPTSSDLWTATPRVSC